MELRLMKAIFETAAGVGAVIACLLATIALLEKITGWFGKWIRNNVKEVLSSTDQKITQLDSYTRYHLGPNGTTTPIFVRIKELEKMVDTISQKET